MKKSDVFYRIAIISVAVLFCLYFFLFQFFLKTDSDYWWHTATGQYILSCMCIPHVDPFSVALQNQIWITHEWFSEVLLFYFETHFSYLSNLIFYSLLSLGSIILVSFSVYIRTNCRKISLFSLFFTSVLFYGVIGVRIQVFSLFFFSLLNVILYLYEYRRKNYLFYLPLIFLLWANIHGAWMMGLFYLLLFFISFLIKNYNSTKMMYFLILYLLSCIAIFCNPNGYHLFIYPFLYLSQKVPLQYINEWQAINLTVLYFQFIAVLIILTIFILFFHRKKLTFYSLLSILLFLYLSLASIRHLPLFGIIAAPILFEVFNPFNYFKNNNKKQILLFVFAFCMSILAGLTTNRFIFLNAAFLPSERGYPKEAISFLIQNKLKGNIFNEYNWGGYIINKGNPLLHVYIDGRTDLYPYLFTEYFIIQNTKNHFETYLTKRNISFVLIHQHTKLANKLLDSKNWSVKYEDKVSILFAKK